MAVDQEVITFIKRELDKIAKTTEISDKRISDLFKKFDLCRERCEHCRETCWVKADHEERMRKLELHAVGSAKGAKLIGACAIAGAAMGVIGNLLARLF